MEESSIKVPKLNEQLLKLDSLLLAVNEDISETVLHCCYGDLHCLVHLIISCSTTVCTGLCGYWHLLSLSLLVAFFHIQNLEK